MSIYPTNQLQRNGMTPRRLGYRLLTTADAVIYATPPDRHAMIDRIFIANNGTNAVTISMHHLGPSEAASTSNGLIHGVSVAGKSYATIDGPIYLSPCDTLVASASASSALCITLYGSESVG